MSGAGHAFLAPSGASIWRRCPASPALSSMFPQQETDATREGVASHWFAAQVNFGNVPAVGTQTPDGTVLTQEMIDGAMIFVDDVKRTREKYAKYGQIVMHETPVKCPSIHPDHCWGTPDTWMHVKDIGRLIFWDYKFGHLEVDPVENDQLATYASGVVDQLGIDGHTEQHITVEFRIVQPRCYTADGPIRTWTTNLTNLRGLWNQLHDAAHLALQPNPPATSGSHCEFCPARHVCTVARKAAMASVDYTGTALPEPLTPDALSFELNLLERAAEAIKARATGLEEQAKQMLKAGKVVPGYGLQPAMGRRRWKPELGIDAIRSLELMYPGVKIVKEEPITPTQAKSAGVDESVIMAYSEVPQNGLKLVKQDNNHIIRILQGAVANGK